MSLIALFTFSLTVVWIPTVVEAELKSAAVESTGSLSSVKTLFTSVINVAIFYLCC